MVEVNQQADARAKADANKKKRLLKSQGMTLSKLLS
jgi:hypothetical protein